MAVLGTVGRGNPFFWGVKRGVGLLTFACLFGAPGHDGGMPKLGDMSTPPPPLGLGITRVTCRSHTAGNLVNTLRAYFLETVVARGVCSPRLVVQRAFRNHHQTKCEAEWSPVIRLGKDTYFFLFCIVA